MSGGGKMFVKTKIKKESVFYEFLLSHGRRAMKSKVISSHIAMNETKIY